MSHHHSTKRMHLGLLALAAALLSVIPQAFSGQTDIRNSPITQSTAASKPNITLLMDTSGSMAWTHMPDDMEGTSDFPPDTMPAGVGYASSKCNVLYYDPDSTKVYSNPVDYTGASLADPSFTAARYNYYSTTDTSLRNLSTQFQAWDGNTRKLQSPNSPQTFAPIAGITYNVHEDKPQPAYYWEYTPPSSGAETLKYNSPACTVPVPAGNTVNTPGGGHWTKVLMTSTSVTDAQRQRFATWYTWYRTRMALTKSSIGQAFRSISDAYRVGLVSLEPGSPVQASKYEPLGTFDSDKRQKWYAKLYAQQASGFSPAREGLARVGRLYGSKLDGINAGMEDPNPTNQTCQRNYTIMTTDGYWNSATEVKGPVGLDGTTFVGQTDGVLTDNAGDTPRPLWDGGTDGSTVTTDVMKNYQYGGNCVTTNVMRTTSQATAATSLTRKSTVIIDQTTAQKIKAQYKTVRSQQQISRAADRVLREQYRTTLTTSTVSKSTEQYYKETYFHQQQTLHVKKDDYKTDQVKTQVMRSFTGVVQQTVIYTDTQYQTSFTSWQVNRTSSQQTKTDTVRRKTDYRTTLSTEQVMRQTDQVTQTRTKVLQQTIRIRYSGPEGSGFAAACPSGAGITCTIYFDTYTPSAGTSGLSGATSQTYSSSASQPATPTPTNLVDSCTTQTAVGPSYVAVTCTTQPVSSGLVATCTNDPASSSNGHITTGCTSSPTTPVAAAADPTTCPAIGTDSTTPAVTPGSSANSYVRITCWYVRTGPTAVTTSTPTVSDCPAGTSLTTVNSWITNPGSGNSYKKTTCTTSLVGTADYAVDPSTPGCTNGSTIAASSSNTWTTSTCRDAGLTTGVASCSGSSSGSPNWIVTTCSAVTHPGTQGVIDPATISTACPAGTTITGTITQIFGPTTDTTTGLTQTCTVTVTGGTTNYIAIASAPSPGCASGSTQYALADKTLPAASGNNYVTTRCITTLKASAANTNPSLCSSGDYVSGSAGSVIGHDCLGPTTSPTTIPASPTFVDPSTCPLAGVPASSTNSWVEKKCTTSANGGTALAINPTTAKNTYTSTVGGCDSTADVTVNGNTTTGTPSSANGWRKITCVVSVASTTAVDPATCPGALATTAGTPTAQYSSNFLWKCTTTKTATTEPVNPALCTNGTTGTIAASSGNGNTTSVCTEISEGTANIATCPSSYPSPTAPLWQIKRCGDTTPVRVYILKNTCSSGTNGTTNQVTTCPSGSPIKTGPTVVQANTCTTITAPAGTDSVNGTDFIYVTCTETTPTVTYVLKSSCTNTGVTTYGSSPSWIKSRCDIATVTSPAVAVAPSNCTNGLDGSGLESICTTDHPGVIGPLSPTDAALTANCPNGVNGTATSAATSPFIAVTCSYTINTSNVAVDLQSDSTLCASGSTATVSGGPWTIPPSSTNSYTKTDCTTTNPMPSQAVAASDCTSASSYASGLRTTCTDNNSTQRIEPTSASLNGTICPTTLSLTSNGSGTVPASAGNIWTSSTCTVTVTGPTAVDPATCTAGVTGTVGVGGSRISTSCPVTAPPAAGVASCAVEGNDPATSANGWVQTTCNTVTTGPTLMAATACTTSVPGSGNGYFSSTCAPIAGSYLQSYPVRTIKIDYTSGGTYVKTTNSTQTGGATNEGSLCYAPADQAPKVAEHATTTPDIAGCGSWPCVQVTTAKEGGSANSLADVAQYYYTTDLRPDLANNVSTGGTGPEEDRKTTQHMTTYVMGLGVSGTLAFDKNYKTASITDTTVGDITGLRNGSKNWPLWPSQDTAQYPQDPTTGNYYDQNQYNSAYSIDDFWHTAINGRGQYFAATDQASVLSGFSSAFADIAAADGAGSGSSVSTGTPAEGDNAIYDAGYTASKWYGEIVAGAINLTSGTVTQLATSVWSAANKLDSQVGNACDKRKIYIFRDSVSTTKLADFTYDSFACDDTAGTPIGTASNGLTTAEKALFDSTAVSKLSQSSSMNATQASAAAGASLVNFLRGQRGAEGYVTGSTTRFYRQRTHVLGDIINSQPVYVKKPRRSYTEGGYPQFKAQNAGREAMLYVGANDGMLHAFYATTDTPVATTTNGVTTTIDNRAKEAWAYIPTPVMPNLYKLADNTYSDNHRYFVDGPITVDDVKDGTDWKTILVGGLGAGGKGFYALDVTNPTSPKALWEFNQNSTCYPGTGDQYGGDCNVGLSYGKPIVTKLADGTWVVLLTSGYNNVRDTPGTGDGGGYLYVLDAMTGKIKQKLATGAGTATAPSGLREINNYVSSLGSNSTARVYGGDLLGNVWRFDVNGTILPEGKEATLVATAYDASGAGKVAQPITTRPELAEVNGRTLVMVGTGRLLGDSDLSDTQKQTIYGIVDPISSSVAYTDLRTSLKKMTLVNASTNNDESLDDGNASNDTRTITCTSGDTVCGSLGVGWYIDLPQSGERMNVKMELQSGTLAFATNVPNNDACSTGGKSWLNYVSFATGGAVSSSAGGVVSVVLATNSLAVGLTTFRLTGSGSTTVGGGGSVSGSTIKIIGTGANGDKNQFNLPVDTQGASKQRVSWREVLQ